MKVVKAKRSKSQPKKEVWTNEELWDADPKCKHKVVTLWSGVKCTKCGGWYCY